MRIFNTQSEIVVESDGNYFTIDNLSWDEFINDDNLYTKVRSLVETNTPNNQVAEALKTTLLPPINRQEIWAAGVTYFRSKVGRQEESKGAGGGEFYARVYEADRPEIFFKSTAARCSGHGQAVRIRPDSGWDVPEPELTLFITSSGKIVGYTIGNDMSSRSIEGENPLYLPQAKTYDKSASLGPCLYVTDRPLSRETKISLAIKRNNETVFEGNVAISQIKRSFEELASWLYRSCSFPYGCFLMTGTGIVPGNDFTLEHGDIISISIDNIGTLTNYVE